MFSDELRPKQLSQICRRINSIQWQIFAPGYLKIDMNEVCAFLPLSSVSISTTAMGLLRTWRNINTSKSTISNLRTILQEMINDGVLKKEVPQEYEKILGKYDLYHQLY